MMCFMAKQGQISSCLDNETHGNGLDKPLWQPSSEDPLSRQHLVADALSGGVLSRVEIEAEALQELKNSRVYPWRLYLAPFRVDQVNPSFARKRVSSDQT